MSFIPALGQNLLRILAHFSYSLKLEPIFSLKDIQRLEHGEADGLSTHRAE